MRKEKIKSIILFILIINCLQLTGQIWFDKKLWPSGYNFFNSLTNVKVVSDFLKVLPFGNASEQGDNLYSSITRPKKIIVSGGGAREVYYSNQKQYGDVILLADKIKTGLFKATSPHSEAVTKEEWQSFLKGKSIYIDYGFNIDMSIMAQSYGVGANAPFSQLGIVSGLVITADTVTNSVIVCAKDSRTGNISKFWSDYKGDELTKYIEGLTFGKQQSQAFAFELNLDRATQGIDIKRKVFLEPLVLLPMNPSNMPKINIVNPLKKDGVGVGQKFADNIVTAFGYAPSSLRKSIMQDGVASYVENSATIKIYPSGLVEYNAIKTDKGIRIQNAKIEPNQIVNSIAKIARDVWKKAGVTQPPDMSLVSDLVEQKSGKYIVEMNYIVEGIPVITQFSLADPMYNALYAEVQDGYIKRFRIVLRTFSVTGEKVQSTPVLVAIDNLFKMYGQANTETKINDIFQCYSSEGGDTSVAQWGVELSNNKGVIIVPSI